MSPLLFSVLLLLVSVVRFLSLVSFVPRLSLGVETTKVLRTSVKTESEVRKGEEDRGRNIKETPFTTRFYSTKDNECRVSWDRLHLPKHSFLLLLK